MIEGLELNSDATFGRALVAVRPDFPAGTKKGELQVEIEVDPKGYVVVANAVSGADELRNAAVEAARLTRSHLFSSTAGA